MSFGSTYPRKLEIRRWLTKQMVMLRDEIGQKIWAEMAVSFMLGHSFVQYGEATFELRYPRAAAAEIARLVIRKQRDGRIRPARALLMLAEGELDEAIEPFAQRHGLNLIAARGFLMVAVLSGEVEFRQAAGRRFMVEAKPYVDANPFAGFARRRQRYNHSGPIPGKYATG